MPFSQPGLPIASPSSQSGLPIATPTVTLSLGHKGKEKDDVQTEQPIIGLRRSKLRDKDVSQLVQQ